MRHRVRWFIISLLIVFMTGAPETRAQAGRSEITGVVHDQSGALIPQGTIRVTDESTKQVITSNIGAGTFTITNLKLVITPSPWKYRASRLTCDPVFNSPLGREYGWT